MLPSQVRGSASATLAGFVQPLRQVFQLLYGDESAHYRSIVCVTAPHLSVQLHPGDGCASSLAQESLRWTGGPALRARAGLVPQVAGLFLLNVDAASPDRTVPGS